MPDPDNIDIKKGGADNWFNWFDLDQVKAEKVYALGKGCLFPCQHCGRGNGLSETRAMPLPVVIKMLIAQEKRTTFAGWYANDVFDWEDPFFGTRFDAVAGFMARENAGKRFFVTTRGWYPADARAQRTAEKVAKIVAAHEVGGFNISFHLGHPRMDIIKAVYDNGGKIPESVVNEYAEYYGNIFRTLGTSVQMVYLYRIEPGFAEYNNATDRALKLAAKIAGRPELAEIGSESDLGAVTREETIDEWGRGKDFMNRLKMAMARDPRCLEPNKRQFMDSEPLGWGIPTVSINDKGEVKVHGGKNEKNIVLTSSMDELDPVPDKRKALTDLVIAVDRIGVSAEKSLKDDGMEAVAAQAPENVKGKSMIVYADDVLKSGCAFDMEKTIKKLASASGKFTGGKVVIFAREEGYALVLEELLVKAGLDREKNIILITEKELSERKGRIENDGAEISAIAAVSRSLGAGEIMGVIRGGVKRPDELNEYAETKLKIPVAVIGAEDAIYSFSQAVRFLVETYAAKGSAGWVRMLPPARTITADMRKMYEEYRRLLRVMVAA
jgi:hypothetical protein